MPSFDIVSEVDLQEVDNAINIAKKEIVNRYDFRGSKSSIELDKTNKLIKLVGDDDFKLRAVIDILQTKIVKRGISLKALKIGEFLEASGGLMKSDVTIVMGIEQEKARKMVKDIKGTKMKVQAQIQEEKVRISGKKKDDLQEAIAFIKGQDYEIPLQFENFRD